MQFNIFKNTFLLFLLVLISCANSSKYKSPINETEPIVQTDRQIIVGANRIDEYLPLLQGKRVGIIANQTSVIFKNILDSTFKLNSGDKTDGSPVKQNPKPYTHVVDSLLSLHINIKKVFTPEHGFRGTADAGELVKDGIDTKTGLPLISLHGKNKKPTPNQLKNLDILVFDIQDIGVRFYTYISTLHYVMEACAEAGIPLVILDRPNPNGNYIDGPTLKIENKSFLGMHPIPLVHGMTIGEYAQMINGEAWLDHGKQCKITIIGLKNYSHNSFYSLPIRPSPNLPNDQSIKLYPSLGLFEGTNVNAGRGTEFQFQYYGAPFLNSKNMSFTYTPRPNFGSKHPKHEGKLCYGEDLKEVTIDGVMTLKWIIKAYKNCTDKSLFFNSTNFTKHAGNKKLQQQIESGLSELEIKATWKDDLERFKKTRKKYLRYK